MKDATGLSQAKAAILLTREWKVFDSIIGYSFDTTASNTGVRAGSATLIQQEMGRRILWLPCRHHILELIIKFAFTALFGERTGPNDLFFKWFQSIWPTIDTDTTDLSKYTSVHNLTN